MCIAPFLAAGVDAQSSANRFIRLYNIHTKETTEVLYKKSGRYLPEAMKMIDWALRDWRRNEATAMDPQLVDLLWEIHNELGSKEPIHIISGYRSQSTNEMLRKSVGGQASKSQHITGKAADVHFPDIPLRQLRYSALIRERGGVGYYPTSAIPFVHVDTARVRHWPRLPRHELALLFPKGKTQHQPASGGPITLADVRAAREDHTSLATQIAAFHGMRSDHRAATAVAAARAPAALTSSPWSVATLVPPPDSAAPHHKEPRLLTTPTIAQRPQDSRAALSSEDRQRLAQLAALAAKLRPSVPAEYASVSDDVGPITTWAAAPQFDDEHPDELSYRPFPIAPLLTASASVDDPVLNRLWHHDASMTVEMIDQADRAPTLTFRPNRHVAQVLMSQQFAGQAVNIHALNAALHVRRPLEDVLSSRRVRTSGR